jgi:hypothetical protein
VSRRILDAIRNAIADVAYDLTRHAVDEMAEDGLLLADVEHAVLTGAITKVEIDDPRGTRYTIVGMAEDLKTEVGVVGRFTETGVYLIITVYEAKPLAE